MNDDSFQDWLVGFIEGEGSFSINVIINGGGIRFTPTFRISSTDEEIIRKIHTNLGFGYIRKKPKTYWKETSPNASDQYELNISSIGDVLKFVSKLNPNRFRTRKKNDYTLWTEGVEIIKKYRHLTREGALKLFQLRDAMNCYGKGVYGKNKGKACRYKTEEWGKKWLAEHDGLFNIENVRLRTAMSKSNRKKSYGLD